MAIKLVLKGNYNKNNDHSLLANRNRTNQHPIEAISNLRETLDKKYDLPAGGIPPSDLSFSVVTSEDLSAATSSLEEKLLTLSSDVNTNKGKIEILEELINIIGGDTIKPDDSLEIGLRQGFREDFLTVGGEREFYTSNNFVIGGEHLQVYRDGELLRNKVDYEEVSENKIMFNYELEGDVFITLIAPYSSTIVSPVHEEIISIPDQTIFKLQNRINVGEHSLSVFVNGVRLEVGTHYTEVNSNTVELISSPYPSGTKFIFRQDRVPNSIVTYQNQDLNHKAWSFKKIIDEPISVINLENPYIPKSSNIEVYLNGLLQFEGAEADYEEINPNEIKFNFDLDNGDVVRVSSLVNASMWTERFVVNSKLLSVVELSNPYVVGKEDLNVFENGILLQPEEDYIEISPTAIQFIEPSVFGSKIIIRRRK